MQCIAPSFTIVSGRTGPSGIWKTWSTMFVLLKSGWFGFRNNGFVWHWQHWSRLKDDAEVGLAISSVSRMYGYKILLHQMIPVFRGIHCLCNLQYEYCTIMLVSLRLWVVTHLPQWITTNSTLMGSGTPVCYSTVQTMTHISPVHCVQPCGSAWCLSGGSLRLCRMRTSRGVATTQGRVSVTRQVIDTMTRGASRVPSRRIWWGWSTLTLRSARRSRRLR